MLRLGFLSSSFALFGVLQVTAVASQLAAFWLSEAPGMEPRGRPFKGGGKGQGGLYSDKARSCGLSAPEPGPPTVEYN